jgi:hypothetical protein
MKKWKTKSRLTVASLGFLLRLLFDLEDGDDTILRNVGFYPNYMAFQLQKQ